uniref:Ribosomal protein L16 n=1 Tax=Dictyomenia sonderi TaxID=2007178 RepID=UPI0022FD806D|nr:Ribosomal protein L16 [Dictyomenia sonderi]WAX04249.1 Ribosomal protein L16 [Dictyomenia sonderi]
MEKNKIKRKKYHFKFKRSLNSTKHILRWGTIGFKIGQTTCISDSQENFLKLLILKDLKQFSISKPKVFFYSKCFYSATKLPLESRMGKGKGEICHFFGYYEKGFILFELKKISFSEAIKLKTQLNKKENLKFKIIY